MAENKLTTVIDTQLRGSKNFQTTKKQIEGMRGDLERAQKSAAGMNTAFSGLSSTLLKAGTAFAAFRISKDIIQTTARFQQQLSDVSTLITGDATKAIGEMEKGITRLIKTIPKSPEELGASAYAIVSAGITDTSKALEVLEQSGKLAVAGLGTTQEATDLLTSALNAFAAEGLSAQKTADLVFTAVKNGKTTVAGLAQGFGSLAPAAAGAGVKLDEVLSATSALTTTGLPAANAYVQLAAAIKALQDPTKEMKTLLKAIGFETGEAAIENLGLVGTLQKIVAAGNGNNEMLTSAFGRMEGFKAATALAGANAEAFRMTLDDMRDDVENLGPAFEKQSQTFESSMQIFRNQLDAVKIQIGSSVIPALNELLKTISKNEAAIKSFGVEVVKFGGLLVAAMATGKIVAWGTALQTSIGVARASMGKAATTTAVLTKSLGKMPKNVAIAIALIGAQIVINKFLEIRSQINAIAESRRSANAALESDYKKQAEILAFSTSAGKKIQDIETKRLALVKLRIEATKEARERSDAFLGSNIKKANEQLALIEKTYKAEEENIKKLEESLTDSERRKLEAIRQTKDEMAAPADTSDIPDVVGGGGGGGGEDTAEKLEKEAEKIREQQQKLYDSLWQTQRGFGELRTSGVDAITDLTNAYNKRVAEMEEQTNDLRRSLLQLTQAFEEQVAGIDRSTAERVVAQEELIASLQEQIAGERKREGDESREQLAELEERLSREQSALKKFNAESLDLEDELTEARRRAALTDFERFLEDNTARREAAVAEFEQRKMQIEAEIAAVEEQRVKEMKIFVAKQKAIETINEAIKNNWSSILDQMENRTEAFAIAAKEKLESIKESLSAIQQLGGEAPSAGTFRAADEFLGAEGRALFQPSAPTGSPTQNVNVTVNMGGITTGGTTGGMSEAELIAKIEEALARSAELIAKKVSPAPNL